MSTFKAQFFCYTWEIYFRMICMLGNYVFSVSHKRNWLQLRCGCVYCKGLHLIKWNPSLVKEVQSGVQCRDSKKGGISTVYARSFGIAMVAVAVCCLPQWKLHTFLLRIMVHPAESGTQNMIVQHPEVGQTILSVPGWFMCFRRYSLFDFVIWI